MSVGSVLDMILGLCLFLFGMTLMSEYLRQSAGKDLRQRLARLTHSPWRAFLLGAAVTAVIQSSSATTVMVVGFVGSGVLSLGNAIGVIMGANLGTTVTSWITALSGAGENSLGRIAAIFKPSSFLPIVALVGILILSIAARPRRRNVGIILLGFCTLMVGMELMSDAVSPLAENDGFKRLLVAFEEPLLGLVAGAVLTAIVQSSSASVGILQSFTVTGAITLGNALPIIMGQNIGTCVTALISSVGADANAKRAAVIHLLFNTVGASVGVLAFYALRAFLPPAVLDGRIDTFGIALAHTAFNLASVLMLMPFSRQIERLSRRIVKDKNKIEGN